ncbi:hypothetical protein BDP55DRAFT_154101 [Colletotrichum godetiae]|uniref:Uncharacterized protein n=1 Tax=Colletotrichum godetiae TaxID=1209918 RepID=A0AAJ0EST9_9PEZI|nr:uncharacterized protein BDP55DRAFT_154101 [Colletotrichum godetiae]KAK1675426.1 hypothetical protein BDP55DRAFT_154101 [Colletotrichum godetiae]
MYDRHLAFNSILSSMLHCTTLTSAWKQCRRPDLACAVNASHHEFCVLLEACFHSNRTQAVWYYRGLRRCNYPTGLPHVRLTIRYSISIPRPSSPESKGYAVLLEKHKHIFWHAS